ncbi:MAG TPA: hypothetical protein VN783_01165 [Thermoanaerobaculia bacterium]|nr:hypothetical protein [Thermoanaerobaculia bacterium]
MKKVLIPLSVLCLLAALVAPMVGCAKKEEPPAESTETTMDTGTEMTSEATPMSTEMTSDTGMTSEAPPAK